MKTKPGRSPAGKPTPTPEHVRMMKGRHPDAAACTIDIARIRSDPHQPRKFFDGLDTLAASMKSHGQLEPIVVWWIPSEGVYEIIAGERRYRAAEMAGMKSLRAFVWNENGRLQAGDKLELQLVENAHREDVLPLEQAAGIRRLMDLKRINASQAAERLQLNKGTVSKLVALLDLDDYTKQRVDNGELSASAAYELTKIADVKDRKALAERAVKTKLTRDEVANLVATKRTESGNGPTPRFGKETVQLPNGEKCFQRTLVPTTPPHANGKIVSGIGWNSKKTGPSIEPSIACAFDPKTDLKIDPHSLHASTVQWTVRLDTFKVTIDPQAMAMILRDVADAVERAGREKPKFDFCSLHQKRGATPVKATARKRSKK